MPAKTAEEARVKCSTLSALPAVSTARFRSSPEKTALFTAAIASQKADNQIANCKVHNELYTTKRMRFRAYFF